MESIIKYRLDGKDHPLVLCEAIKEGCNLSKKSLINYILTNNTNSVFPVVDTERVVPIYPVEVYEYYKEKVRAESEKNIEKMFHDLLIENIESSSKFEQKALLLSGGIDSILVAGILAKLYSAENVRFYHMRHGAFTKGETERARKVAEKLGIKLIEVNKGIFTPEDYLAPIKINAHSVDLSAPSYLEVSRQIRKEQGVNVDVFNGELNLIDVGFSESSDPTRGIRRFVFNHLKAFDWIAKVGVQRVAKISGKSKYVEVLNEIMSFLFERNDKVQFVSGFYNGKAHFPGFYGWNEIDEINHKFELSNFLNNIGYKYSQDFNKFLYQTAPAFYSGTTNVETVGSLLWHLGMNYVMPYSSPSLASISLSMSQSLTRNKAIQKKIAYNIYGIDHDVAYYLKDHSGYNQSFASHFDQDSFKSKFSSGEFDDQLKFLALIFGQEKMSGLKAKIIDDGILTQEHLRVYLAAESLAAHKYV
jgi:hypothetical protein